MKFLSTLILGATLHMLYIDYAIYNSVKQLDDCIVALEPFDLDTDVCFQLRREVQSAYKGKYFNLVTLAKFKAVGSEKWSME